MMAEALSDCQTQDLRVETLSPVEVGNVQAEVVKFEKAHCLLLYHAQYKEANWRDS